MSVSTSENFNSKFKTQKWIKDALPTIRKAKLCIWNYYVYTEICIWSEPDIE